jgi:protein phosphatase
MKKQSIALSDVGRKRPHNEDFFLRDDKLGLYIVADGVGGHAKGEIASQEAVEQLAMWVRQHMDEIDQALALGTEEALRKIARMLESGVQSACYMVFGMAELDPEKKGMSTTMSALLVRGERGFVAQVGDSRVYRLRGRKLEQMTEDHTLINYKLKQGLITQEQAKMAAGKNVITRAVGHKDYVQVDTMPLDIKAGDRFLLCTDGLHTYVEEAPEIARIMSMEPIESGVEEAINLANARGGKDNITALIVVVAG